MNQIEFKFAAKPRILLNLNFYRTIELTIYSYIKYRYPEPTSRRDFCFFTPPPPLPPLAEAEPDRRSGLASSHARRALPGPRTTKSSSGRGSGPPRSPPNGGGGGERG